ncbi:hypothetical protein AAFF_G00136140 [Aldrovandia affinis]|uniref:Dickkopf N-terminal cysteine-rich domain-containing protein n=1 Tax=Aldrovandia affinis TaxID=143900 RepID=A0AAD7W9A9_9TELE|nr:hypothetical protein AAFF_G00136140 [Aldrovandia affinis]
MFSASVPVFAAVCLALCCYVDASSDASVQLNSNSIKNIPGGVTSPSQTPTSSPALLPVDSGSQNIAIDTFQPLNCAADEECGADEFCNESRGACLKCRKFRKRCARDAMCCPGNQCRTGVCLSSDDSANQPAGVNRTLDRTGRRISPGWSQPQKGREGESCLRSTDCAGGLCCARHFWSRICKPVLTDGQVCSKHKRKGSRGVEIFQRCNCRDGLSCRAQKGHHASGATRSLNTCQRR